MALPVEYHPAAREEFDAAMSYYEAARAGLGSAFLQAVEVATRRTQQVPLGGTPVLNGIRRVMLRRFPYGLLYAVEDTRIFVLAIAHVRRRPGYWQSRRG